MTWTRFSARTGSPSSLRCGLPHVAWMRLLLSGLPELETERILLMAARVGQHVFAVHVLANCGSRCVFSA